MLILIPITITRYYHDMKKKLTLTDEQSTKGLTESGKESGVMSSIGYDGRGDVMVCRGVCHRHILCGNLVVSGKNVKLTSREGWLTETNVIRDSAQVVVMLSTVTNGGKRWCPLPYSLSLSVCVWGWKGVGREELLSRVRFMSAGGTLPGRKSLHLLAFLCVFGFVESSHGGLTVLHDKTHPR